MKVNGKEVIMLPLEIFQRQCLLSEQFFEK